MLLLLGLSFLALLFLMLMAAPVGSFLVDRLGISQKKSAISALGLTLIVGFAYSALAASWSYGVFGIDTYPLILLTLGVITWVGFAVRGELGSLKFFRDGWTREDWFLFLPIAFSFYLTRGYWSGPFSLMLRAGDGPDTTQNLMAAQSARTMGATWNQQASYFLENVNQPSLRDGVMDLYRLASFREQAGIDYLVYGTRWGLSVPYSQILRFFGNGAILWETGLVLAISLLCISVVTYATVNCFSKSKFTPAITSLAVAANTPFLVQFYNGGLSQGWALVGTSGMFFALTLHFSSSSRDRSRNRNIFALFTFAWLAITVTYIDASIVLVLFALIAILVLTIFSRTRVIPFIKLFFGSGVLAALLVPMFTFASLLTFDFRIRAASGTGIPSQIWPLPSEILGFVDIFSSGSSNRTPETLLIALVITLYFLYKLTQGQFKLRNLAWLSYLGLTGLLVVGIGYILSITGKLSTNYIYLKVATYVAPLLIISLFLLLDGTESVLRRSKIEWNMFVPTLLMIVALFSSQNSVSNLNKSGTNIPPEFSSLLNNKSLQAELSKYNYFVPYLAVSNFFGVLGNTHWISKAPNDLILNQRLDIELRLLCFASDTSCKPITARIANPELERFGIFVFKAPMTTREFYSLTPRQRFDANFKAFGQEPQQIPDRFVGGNPYYN